MGGDWFNFEVTLCENGRGPPGSCFGLDNAFGDRFLGVMRHSAEEDPFRCEIDRRQFHVGFLEESILHLRNFEQLGQLTGIRLGDSGDRQDQAVCLEQDIRIKHAVMDDYLQAAVC